MNQLCKVCGEPAAGFHFGAFTCEGCKSFFGRTYNNLSSISDCKNNGECVINKKNRTTCKACRLRKCLLVGMSKSGSRYGRRSNWFKIHCLLQEQQQAGANIAAAANLLRPHPYLTPLFRHPPTATHHHGRDTRSSESDSGASSADPEDDLRSTSGLSYLKPSTSPSSDRDYYSSSSGKKLPSPSSDTECIARSKYVTAAARAPSSISPASLPSVSPSSVVPKWFPPLQGISDPAAWRELWLRGPAAIAAVSAPDNEQPIDLSIKQQQSSNTPPPGQSDNEEQELSIDVGVDEPVKPVPLDLTLDRQVTDVTN